MNDSRHSHLGIDGGGACICSGVFIVTVLIVAVVVVFLEQLLDQILRFVVLFS
jgi:hypothetical protein